MRWLLAPLLVALLVAFSMAPRAQAQPGPRIVQGRIWVQLKDRSPATLRARAGALGEGAPEAVVPQQGAVVLRVPVGQEVQAARRLAARADVDSAVTIPVVTALETPSDPYLSQQWALSNIHAPQAWDVITCTVPVTIAIVDTGVELTHSDLAAQVVPGWDFAHGDADPSDDYGHGTHVAGIAAATTDNGVGIAGAAWGARIMPVKVLDEHGIGSAANVVQGINYAVDHGARIVNLSLGGDAFEGYQLALDYARNHGVLVVAAAGNSGGAVLYPAAYAEAMAVAATDPGDQKASFSCSGPQISVAAPGVDVLSTYLRGGYGYMTGTSMAAPHVSGLAALVWALHPSYGPDEVRATIERSADDVNYAEHPGWDEYLCWGRINAARAVGVEPHWTWLPCVQRGGATRVDAAESHPAWLPYACRP